MQAVNNASPEWFSGMLVHMSVPEITSRKVPRGFEKRLGLLVNRLGSQILSRASAGFDALGLDGRDYATLAVLADDHPPSQQELADLLGLVPAAIVPLVDGLQDRGLVERQRDPADRRRTAVLLTDHGVARLAQADAVAADVEQDVFSTLSATERDALHDAVRRVMASTWPG